MAELTLTEIYQEPNTFIRLEGGRIRALWSYKSTSIEDDELPRALRHLDWLKKVAKEARRDLSHLVDDVHGWIKFTIPFNTDPIVLVERIRARQETIDELHRRIALVRKTCEIYEKAIIKQESTIYCYIRSIDTLEEGEIV
ncbi:Oidioi.mRNA.OKI2018_I69.XSR.g14636.t1.cds [Oikopleura dioica]|uniref:Oidioi.mRNA.OKI2018_I69.XSR.g14636.t1.cds n=1 Tax=Oikopleura dioica TaxID=34765 RepID=A0ABN7SAG2_OIKDI|nr:Oidioi.mRNA.OKI2018_I69.XSR.g14636.t1.cds [Oikopleura dioica]